MFQAIEKDNYYDVKLILENENLKNAILNKLIYNYKKSNSFSTPLSYAISLRHAKVVDLLIEYGADVDQYIEAEAPTILHLTRSPDMEIGRASCRERV